MVSAFWLAAKERGDSKHEGAFGGSPQHEARRCLAKDQAARRPAAHDRSAMGQRPIERLRMADRRERQVDCGLSGARRKRTSRDNQGQYCTLGGKSAARLTWGFGGCLQHAAVIVRYGVILAMNGLRVKCVSLLLVRRADRG